ncbi:MAG: helix-turn-helix transcriptional regulator [Bacteriovoracaceae bacterium]|jgi:transcriptional regulator with XRE-family HTH domain|nr:helix-turn-helix transcriptional regulator [Bacteriovoracaceae bacterium]
MNEIEKNYAKNIKDLFLYIRKVRNISQRELASHVYLSQSIVSRIENEKYLPSVGEWGGICHRLGVSPSSLLDGFLDSLKVVHGSFKYEAGNLRVPEMYKKNATYSMRAIAPLFLYAKKQMGEVGFNKVLNNYDLDEHITYCFDTKLNFKFFLDFTKEVIGCTDLGKKDIFSEIDFLSPKCHGHLHHVYNMIDTPHEIAGVYVKQSNKYDCNFTRKLRQGLDGILSIDVTPGPFYTNQLSRFTDSDCQLIKEYDFLFFENICKYSDQFSDYEVLKTELDSNSNSNRNGPWHYHFKAL